MAVLDLTSNTFTEIIGLGAKDFSLPGNQIDPKDNDDGRVHHRQRQGPLHAGCDRDLQMARPDLSRARQRRGLPRGQRRSCTAGERPISARSPGPAAHLQHRFVAGQSLAAGARSFSIRDADGTMVYDSGSILDSEAHERGVYDDGRSRDKGVEPEGIALMEIDGRTYAFVGLERTTQERGRRVRRHQAARGRVPRHDRHGRRRVAGRSGGVSSSAATSTWRSPMNSTRRA